MCPHCIATGVGAAIAAVPIVKYLMTKTKFRLFRRKTKDAKVGPLKPQ
jgi:hypothetical protein